MSYLQCFLFVKAVSPVGHRSYQLRWENQVRVFKKYIWGPKRQLNLKTVLIEKIGNLFTCGQTVTEVQ